MGCNKSKVIENSEVDSNKNEISDGTKNETVVKEEDGLKKKKHHRKKVKDKENGGKHDDANNLPFPSLQSASNNYQKDPTSVSEPQSELSLMKFMLLIFIYICCT